MNGSSCKDEKKNGEHFNAINKNLNKGCDKNE